MEKKQYKVTNWPEYNRALKNRYSLTLWLDEDTKENWPAEPTGRRGRPFTYSEMAITCCLTMRSMFGLPLRGTEGFMNSILCHIGLSSPDYTILSRRSKTMDVRLPSTPKDEPIHLLIDSSGLKVFGEGEWKVRTHGIGKRRTWRKLHIGVNAETGEIAVAAVSTSDVADCDMLPKMLPEVETPIASVTADGAYDKKKDYKAIKRAGAVAIIPPRWDARLWGNRRPHERDIAVLEISRIGLKRWKRKIGYHRRSLAETTFFRIKRMFGDRLRSRIFDNQTTEAFLICSALNRMTALGMPKSRMIS
jgi:IS5 family transposase